MSATKILIIVLVVIAVLFVVLMVWGINSNSKASMGMPANTGNSTKSGNFTPEDANKFAPDSMMSGLSGILAPFATKLDPKQMQPALTACNPRAKQTCVIEILPDPKHNLRQSKFKVQPETKPACAHLVYQSSGSEDPKTQDSNDAKNPSEFTFAIFKEGGTLKIDRSTGSCQVSLE